MGRAGPEWALKVGLIALAASGIDASSKFTRPE